MSILDPNIDKDLDRYMENRFEFDRNFESKVVSVLVIDPNDEFPLKDIGEDNIMYFDLSNITENDYLLMGKWITQHIVDGEFTFDGLIFDNADHIPSTFGDKQNEYNMEQMIISALKREDDFQIVPWAYPSAPIPFDKIMVAVRCKSFPEYLWGKSLQARIMEIK